MRSGESVGTLTVANMEEQLFEVLYAKFENLRKERMSLIKSIPDDTDVMLADIANMATLLYITRKTIEVMPSLQQDEKADER